MIHTLVIYISWIVYAAFVVCAFLNPLYSQSTRLKTLPYLTAKAKIDGDLSEWKSAAFSEGTWNMERVKTNPWYESGRNKLNVDKLEDANQLDLSATYYLAWDSQYVYFGAEVLDNVNDVTESRHEPKRWYYKDAIAIFLEVPSDTISEKFAEGDHAFCFVIDTLMPDYGRWWRHGTAAEPYLEESLPKNSSDYKIKMNPWGRSNADYILEARVNMRSLIGNTAAEEGWKSGNTIGLMIVHCDPDGGEYGGHMLIYGKGDDDATWQKMELVQPGKKQP